MNVELAYKAYIIITIKVLSSQIKVQNELCVH